MPSLLAAHGVSLRFGGVAAVQDVSLQVVRGSITALVGPSGAGKSVLIGLLSGLLAPDVGSVEFDGRDLAGLHPDALCRMGLVRTFQEGRPFCGQTVRANIAVGAQLHLRERYAALAQADEVARQVGLGAQLHKAAARLRMGQRRRLELGRAVAMRPRLLLLDGLLDGLAPDDAAQMQAVIRGLSAEGVTILMAERLLREVSGLAESVGVLCGGRLIAMGTAAEVRGFLCACIW
ncbi:ABC transporter ATP-binding protein [Cupriavidus necator]